MKRQRYGFIFLLLIFYSAITNAQQLPLYSQYILNNFLLNPAIAGSDGYTSFNITSRKQWLGYADGPTTYSASYSARLLKRKTNVVGKKLIGARSGNVGIGANIFSDRNGALLRTGGAFTYAYHIHFKEGQLSFGLTGSLEQVGLDKSRLTQDFISSEPTTIQSALATNVYIPDAATGIYYIYRNFFTGLSVDQLFQSELRTVYHNVVNPGTYLIDYQYLRQYYYMIGYNLPVADNYSLEPSMFLRTNEKLNNLVDVTLKVIYKRSFWMSYGFRTDFIGDQTSIVSVGFRLDEFYFGYSFDYQSDAISLSTYGTHELVLAYKLGDSQRRYRWLDRF
jgi:type IX secretion system PorP/SprF family membrane protein